MKRQSGKRGSAMILVLALVVIMTALVIGNGVVLHQLHQQLRIVDQQQQRRFEPPRP